MESLQGDETRISWEGHLACSEKPEGWKPGPG